MAFKMKGSAFKLKNVATKSALKQTEKSPAKQKDEHYNPETGKWERDTSWLYGEEGWIPDPWQGITRPRVEVDPKSKKYHGSSTNFDGSPATTDNAGHDMTHTEGYKRRLAAWEASQKSAMRGGKKLPREAFQKSPIETGYKEEIEKGVDEESAQAHADLSVTDHDTDHSETAALTSEGYPAATSEIVGRPASADDPALHIEEVMNQADELSKQEGGVESLIKKHNNLAIKWFNSEGKNSSAYKTQAEIVRRLMEKY